MAIERVCQPDQRGDGTGDEAIGKAGEGVGFANVPASHWQPPSTCQWGGLESLHGLLSFSRGAFQIGDSMLEIRDGRLETCDCFLETRDIGEEFGFEEAQEGNVLFVVLDFGLQIFEEVCV